MTDEHRALIERLTATLAADSRVRAAWLGGSLGQDAGDAWSDVDIVVLVEDQDRAACIADYRADHPGLPPLVLSHVVYGRVLAAITPDWERFDLSFLTAPELPSQDGAALKLLLGDPGQTPPPRAQGPSALQPLGPLVTEFLRVLGLAPVAVGRGEWLTMQQGVELLRHMLIDLMLLENQVPPGSRGAKRLNAFLTNDQRAWLEALPPPLAEREALIAANTMLARQFLAHAKPLAAKLGTPWPTAFEDATRRHLKATLSLEI